MDRPPNQRVGSRKSPAKEEGRVPPYSQDAEAAVLGGILLNNHALAQVQEIIKSEDFYIDAHRRIYEAIESLSKLSLPIDHLTLGNELRNHGNLEKIGGAMALANLTDSVATVANVDHYATIVKEHSAVRRMIYAAQEVVARGFSDYGEAGEYLDEAESAIFKASQEHIGAPYVHVSQIVDKTFRDLDLAAKHAGGEITGVPSGFSSLDKMTAGFQPSDLIIVAGRPAMGKTSLALNMAVNAAKETGHPALVFSLEMSKDQLVRRMLSSEGRVDATRMRANRLETDDWPRLIEAANILHQSEIYLDDSAPMTPLEIRAKSRRLQADKGLSMIVVDYLQLMRSGGRRTDNREQEISEISRSLKGLAKEINVPVIALSQLNRGVESRPDKRPMMSDLRESGAIEQDADLILFVYRDEVYKEDTEKRGIAEIIIGKQRSGPTGHVDLRFFQQYTRFENLTNINEQQGAVPQPDLQGPADF